MRPLSISACLFAGLFPLAEMSSAGPAFDELVRAAGGGDYNLPPLPSPNVDFDGGGFNPGSF